jgi:glycosyltransferase involved in cell wall biosynthesis
MKIAHVTATFPPNFTGTGIVCYHNCLELAKLGHDVTIFTANHPKVEYEYPGIFNVERIDPLFRIGNGPFLPRLLKIKGFDIVHYLNSKLSKSGYVLTYHQDLIGSGVLKYIFKMQNALLLRKMVGGADRIFPTSIDYAEHSFIKNIVEKRGDDVMDMPNGVDVLKFHPDVPGAEIKRKHDIDDAKIILFVGSLDRAHFFKGVDVLLKSFSKIKERDVYLVIVGGGDMMEYYIRLAQTLGISDRVIFPGKVSDEDLPKYYSASDLVVLPSVTMGEAFGIVLLEAMASGKPVIASNLPGVRTVVNEGSDGFLVGPRNGGDLTEKMSYFLENEETSERFGKKGRKKVEEKYSWERIGKRLERAYLDYLG